MPRVYRDGGGGKRGGGRHLIPPVESGRNGRETVPAPSGILDIFLFLYLILRVFKTVCHVTAPLYSHTPRTQENQKEEKINKKLKENLKK